jgi:hypothetical protein
VSEESVQGSGGVTGKGFVPGKSGNPGGLPTWVKTLRDSLKELAPKGRQVVDRIFTRALNTEALEKIIDDGESTPEQVLKAETALQNRLALASKANEVVLGFVLPKPKQRVAVSGQLGNPLGDVPTEEIQALIRAAKGEGK